MDDLSLLIDLHIAGQRQGPGGDIQTRQALDLSGLREGRNLKIADIGCGTGASTLVLAQELDAQIIAIDFLPEFLEALRASATAEGLVERIDTRAIAMEYLPFDTESLDAIWSEGAIYNIGFEHGVTAWNRYLKPGGILAVSELTWLTDDRPQALQEHWDREYPQVATASRKIAQLEAAGYTPTGYFPLPAECWNANYYDPMEARFDQFLDRNAHSPAARAIVDAEKAEIALYRCNSDFVSYGFYIARKL